MAGRRTPDTPILLFRWTKGPQTFVPSGLATSVGVKDTDEGLRMSVGMYAAMREPLSPKGRELVDKELVSRPIRGVVRADFTPSVEDFALTV